MPTINHASLWTNDLEVSKTFYEFYFGARSGALYHNQRTGFKSYFLSFDDGARLEIMQRPDIAARPTASVFPGTATGPGAAPQQTIGLAHLAFSVGSAEAVDALTRRLEADGFTRLDGPRTTGDGYYESVLLDPDGNRIEVTI